MRWAAPVALAALAAASGCGADGDPFRVRVTWATGGSLSCPASSCRNIPLGCEATVSVRIVDAATPSIAYVSACDHLTPAPNLCGLGQIEFPGDRQVPRTMVRIQVAVWPSAALPDDRCPLGVKFDPRGLPQLIEEDGVPVPAIGGEVLFPAGSSSEAVVQLGCPDADALAGEACQSSQPIAVSATVDDFARRASVTGDLASYLIISVGEPVERIDEGGGRSHWELPPTDLRELQLEAGEPSPVWTGDVAPAYDSHVCLEVLHRLEGTPTVVCRTAPHGVRTLDLGGAYVSAAARGQLLAALGLAAFPPDGLVLGRVVDADGGPVRDVALVPSPTAAIAYLNDDGTAVDPTATATTKSGMFVSLDAPPRTIWSLAVIPGMPPVAPVVGGRVVGHLSVVEVVVDSSDQE